MSDEAMEARRRQYGGSEYSGTAAARQRRHRARQRVKRLAAAVRLRDAAIASNHPDRQAAAERQIRAIDPRLMARLRHEDGEP